MAESEKGDFWTDGDGGRQPPCPRCKGPHLPKDCQSSSSSQTSGDALRELKALRYRLAREKGMSAHSCSSVMQMSLDNIFSDKLLHALAEAMPQDLEALGRVPGFSQAKLEKLGAHVLAVCENVKKGRKRAGDDSADPQDDAKRQALQTDGVQKEQLTAEQQRWAEIALNGASLFLTGEAGTGKSFLLTYIVQELKKLRMIAVTASTGIAAASLGGSTIHSFAGAGIAKGDHEEIVERLVNNVRSRSRWQEVQVLVIDEISMLDANFFSLLERIAQRVRGKENRWGGLQLILCGDFLQLPPVETNGFAFETEAWRAANLQVAELTIPMRQQGDTTFFKLLSEVRIGICSAATSAMLAKCVISKKPLPTDGIEPTRLYCVNKDVDAENAQRLASLAGELEEIHAQDTWKSVSQSDRAKLLDLIEKKTSTILKLKIGAQVILTRNDPSQGLVNGTRGVIESWSDKKVNNMRCPMVRTDTGAILKVEPVTHSQPDASGTGELVRIQLPMKLGWALTVHKAVFSVNCLGTTCSEWRPRCKSWQKVIWVLQTKPGLV
eukprot:TRINITY_DN10587_c0_g1_i1.p1 TRINITY_DN10587_c0_g1~~TRINITY_DN10587_c0_g1_i1.p1  ORF type:complete len:559 (-),score=111.96 TRINITY_DN10587_c0_g1_i1:75-1730(-)